MDEIKSGLIHKNAIVKYDKRFCKFIGLNLMNKIDLDLFYSVLSIVRERRMKETVISMQEIIDRSKYASKNQTAYTYKALDASIAQMVLNVHDLAIVRDTDEMIGVINLFDTFLYDKKKKQLLLCLGNKFSNVFFDIPANQAFTQFQLDTFLPLKSSYAKILYRLLLDNYRGFTMGINDFYGHFGVKSASSKKQFIFRLKDYIEEIQQTKDFLDNPPITYTLNRLTDKPRSKIVSITFDFTVNPDRNRTNPKLAPVNMPVQGEILSPRIIPLCPHCGGKLVDRKHSQTGKPFIGHEDFLNCDCPKKTYSSLDEVQEECRLVAEEKAELEKGKKIAIQNEIYQKAKAAEKEEKNARVEIANRLRGEAVSEESEVTAEYVDTLFARILNHTEMK